MLVQPCRKGHPDPLNAGPARWLSQKRGPFRSHTTGLPAWRRDERLILAALFPTAIQTDGSLDSAGERSAVARAGQWRHPSNVFGSMMHGG
jgi:hypothetical protein